MKHHDLDFLQSELTRVSEWVQFADKKAGFAAIFYSATLGFLATQRDQIFTKILLLTEPYTTIYTVVFICLLALLVVGSYFLLTTISPRLTNKHTDKSLFFFGTIARMKIEDYRDAMAELNEEGARRQIIEQIYTNSVIADVKMCNAKRGTDVLVGVGILLSVIFFL